MMRKKQRWLIHTNQLFAQFLIILVVLGVALAGSVVARLPVTVVDTLVLLIAVDDFYCQVYMVG